MITLKQKTVGFHDSSVLPLVSVIISNYNYGRFLPQAIDSVLAQTYQNFELIVVDDGSTDNSQEVIESYSAHLIAYFQKNEGQGAALTAGILMSKGEIICFLDADDYYHHDKLKKVVAAFIEHPEWIQVSHSWISVDGEGVPTNRSAKYLSCGDVRQMLLQRGKYGWGITSAIAYRRSVLEQVLPIPKQPRAADTYLTATVPFYGAVGCINEPLMFYRIHGRNRRAHCDDVAYLIEQRQDTAECINRAAARVGLEDRFDLQQDVDYRSYKALQQGGTTGTEVMQILWLSLQESISIRRSFSDTLNRLIQRGICAALPIEGRQILGLGLRGYLRSRLLALK